VITLDEKQFERNPPVCVSLGDTVVTDIPSCTGVVQAGNNRSVPEISTMQSRQAPTGVSPSRSQSVGMRLPLARAACRMVWPSKALINSPSIRTESFFCGKAVLLYLAHFGDFDVATQASARFIQRLFMAQAHDHLGVGTDPHDPEPASGRCSGDWDWEPLEDLVRIQNPARSRPSGRTP